MTTTPKEADIAYLVGLAFGLAEDGIFFEGMEDPMDWCVRRWEELGGDPDSEFTADDLVAAIRQHGEVKP